MKYQVREILKLACTFLGLDELLSDEYFSVEESELESYVLARQEESPESLKELNSIKDMLNRITNEISSQVVPLYESFDAIFNQNGEFCFENLENVFQIVSVQDCYGTKLKFKVRNQTIFCESGKLIVNYTRYAKQSSLYQECENFNGQIPLRVIAYGVAMEYCLINSMFEEADMWESRFKNSLLSVSSQKKSIVMPAQRWE